MNKVFASTLIFIGLAAASAPLVLAQTVKPPAPSAAQTQTQQGARHQHEKRAFSMPGERVEAQLAYIKTALKITDAQQSQWNAFAETLRKQAGERDKQIQTMRTNMAQRGERRQPTALDRLEREQQYHTAAIAQLNARLAVQKPLYAALTNEQKQVADRVLLSRGGHGKSRHRGPHRMV